MAGATAKAASSRFPTTWPPRPINSNATAAAIFNHDARKAAQVGQTITAEGFGGIATMMRLAGEGGAGREGTRMGLWGAAQAAAFGLGGLVGTAASDLAHALLQDSRSAYVAVFAFQSLMFLASAVVAMRMRAGDVKPSEMSLDNHVLWKGGSTS